MEYLVSCTLWIWVFVSISGVVAIQKSGTFADFQTDKTITGYDLYSVPVISKLECVVRCLEDERCTAAVTYCEALDMLKVSSCILKSISSSPLLSSATKSESGKCFVSLYSLSNGNLGSSSSTSSTVVATNFEATTKQTTTEEITTTEKTISSTVVATNFKSTTEQTTAEEIPTAETTTSPTVVATNFEATTEQTTAEEITTAETTTSPTVVATNFEATSEQTTAEEITTTAETTTSSTVVATNFESTTEQTTAEEITTAEKTTSSTVGTTNFEATTEQTTAEEIPTTAETTTSSTNPSYILGMVGNLENMCSVGSDKDIALFTKNGIFIYNSEDDLNSGHCLVKYSEDFESLFPGYTSDRPPLNDIDCAVGYQNFIEVYAENKVWKWTVNFGAMEPLTNLSTTFSSQLGGTILLSNPQWCTYRQKISRDYYFYENSTFIFKSDQSPFEKIFTQEENFVRLYLLDLNPWKKLPAGTVAVCSVNDQYTMYIVVTSDMSFYEYEIDYSTGNDNPTVSITLKGSIKF